jgi:DNA invertase Pin-like site-specific DNA recombinase
VARTPKKTADPEAVVGYIRVSTSEQADSGAGLDAQRSQIMAEVERKGWRLVAMLEDAGVSAKSPDRPGIAHALGLLRAGNAGTLMVAKMDRATRSTVDAGNLLAQSRKEGWSLVALDLGLDPTTPTGELVASILAATAQCERRAIGARTRDALAARRADGVRLGRPTVLPPEVVDRILAAHQRGMGWTAIARELNSEGVPTAHGGAQWHPSTVRAVALAQ